MTGARQDKSGSLALLAQRMVRDRVTPSLKKSATQMVFGEGNPDAKVVFIGEAPGLHEDLVGRPFVGAAGKILTALLDGVGLRRDQVYITNIVKYRPPDNRDPTPSEISESMPYLKEQLAIIEPKLIVLLGRHATNVFLPKLRISEAHGQVVKLDSQTYLPLYHPAAALHNGRLRQTLASDFRIIPEIITELA